MKELNDSQTRDTQTEKTNNYLLSNTVNATP